MVGDPKSDIARVKRIDFDLPWPITR